MEIKAFTGIGMRHRQEDAYRIVNMTQQGRTLLAIADGMGGHAYGDEASQIVVSAVADYWNGNPKRSDSEKKIIDAVAQAAVIYEKKAAGREMGSTLAMAAIEGGQVYIAHCGDSRIYVWHKLKGQRFHTDDHTKMSPEGWELVTNAFFPGMCDDIVPEIRKLAMQPGDRLMLCTDGIFKYIPEAELWRVFSSDASIESVAEDLEAYCMAMSADNFTALIVEF